MSEVSFVCELLNKNSIKGKGGPQSKEVESEITAVPFYFISLKFAIQKQNINKNYIYFQLTVLSKCMLRMKRRFYYSTMWDSKKLQQP